MSFQDEDTSEYTHALVWGFEPTLATSGETPLLELRTFLHKKYWSDITPDLTIPTYAYECLDCGEVYEAPPHISCRYCNSETTARYDSLETYNNIIDTHKTE